MSNTTPRWYKPKLIEVGLPLEEINRESAREKSIRHGHPSTLHLWWARRPLAAARAVLFAQLVDDPSANTDRFPTEEAQARERERLYHIIRKLVVWENIHDEKLLEEARKEIWNSCGGNPPPVLDPFAGGGTIPLEAQRLGLEAHASDLNPVAVLINKALIEIPPKWAGCPPVFPGAAETANSWPGATGLAEDVRRYGKWMRDEAERRIGYLYPKAELPDGTEATVIAWIWARTVTCPSPACSGTMPLVRSFHLGKMKGRERYIQPILDGKRVRFEVRGPGGVPAEGTVGRTGATCLICRTPVPLAYIRSEGQAGRMGAQLMAIVAEGTRQRYYLSPNDEHEAAANVLRPEDIPDAPLPHNPRNFSTPNYGMRIWADLFSNRQLVSLLTCSALVTEARVEVEKDAVTRGVPSGEAAEYAAGVATYLGFCISRIADRNNTVCTWDSGPSTAQTSTGGSARTASVRNAFARQAIPMTWDYAESSPFSGSGGSIDSAITWLVPAIANLPASSTRGSVRQADASTASAIETGAVIATDPPYYNNIGYADLSDFFYVWLRLSLRDIYPDVLATLLTPKAAELVATPYRFNGSRHEAERHFEQGLSRTFSYINSAQAKEFPVVLFYAFKQAERDAQGQAASTGWETMLEGLIQAGLSVTATWPMRTELSNRMLGFGTNALASSILLACRSRSLDAGVIDRRGFMTALRAELPGALRMLQQGGIAPVDLPQAAIGPGMAVFSRYARVNEPDGSTMRIRPALALINQVLDEVLAQQEGDFGADTRWCLEWFKTYGFDDGPFGIAETMSKAKNTSVDGLERAGVLWSRAGKVHLLSTDDLPMDYDPARDDRVSEWEIVMHLAKKLQERGGDEAARFMGAAKAVVDLDSVRELAYLLFSIAERRGWVETARLFNGLATSWTDLADASRNPAIAAAGVQGDLGFKFG